MVFMLPSTLCPHKADPEVTMKSPLILIVTEDHVPGEDLRDRLTRHAFNVTSLPEHSQALNFLHRKNPDLVIISSKDGHSFEEMQFVKEIRSVDQAVPLILITEQSSEDLVVEALRSGVNDYFKVPFSFQDLLASIRSRVVRSENICPATQGARKMIGESRPMREIALYVARVAATDSTVLITGESGTGKELVASLIHEKSKRKAKPFVCVNCAAMPDSLVESEMFGYERGAFTGAVSAHPGKFEAANGGTVFLDEISDMTPFAQAKLLRTVESKEICRLGSGKAKPLDVRLMAATNRDPETLITEGKFREDLYYRLNIARVHLPPLRERKEDIERLIAHGIEKMNLKYGRHVQGLSPEAMESLSFVSHKLCIVFWQFNF
jgi:DNA-binding NtrC family response regulator